MKEFGDKRFEALVYSKNRTIMSECCKAFAELPIDWVAFDDEDLLVDYLSKEQFQIVLLDLDCSEGAALLNFLNSAGTSNPIVLVISNAPIDPGVLELCYKSEFFYPVRPSDIEDQLSRAVSLSEVFSAQDYSGTIELRSISQQTTTSPALIQNLSLNKLRYGLSSILYRLSSVFRMQHSLSVVAQERVASGMSAAGAIWLVNDVLGNFRGFAFMGPPSVGPMELIALSVLLWICAKNRRALTESSEAASA